MRRLFLAMAVLTLCAILSGSAAAQGGTQVFDHFLCYYVPNQPVLPIPLQLQDQFDSPNGVFEQTTQLQIMRFCNPATKVDNGTTYPIGNINHHLTLYQLNPQPILSRQVVITNQFGANVTIYTSDARVLATPTGKGLPPNSAPPPSTDLDHYKCYVASGPNANRLVTVTDQFNSNLSLWALQPVLFCNPVEKINGSVTTPIQFPSNHLTCYATTPVSVPVQTIFIANQFITSGTGLKITVNNPDMLCAPTTKVSWSVFLPPGGGTSATQRPSAGKANKP